MATYDPRMSGYGESERRTVPGDGVSDRPVGSLVSEFLDQARRLLRAEFQLARTELKQEARKVQSGGALIGAGAVLLLFGGMAFTAFACVALAQVMPWWLATLLVTVVWLAVGGALVMSGIKRMKQVHAPNETIRTLKEDGQWASKTFQSVKSQMHGHA